MEIESKYDVKIDADYKFINDEVVDAVSKSRMCRKMVYVGAGVGVDREMVDNIAIEGNNMPYYSVLYSGVVKRVSNQRYTR